MYTIWACIPSLLCFSSVFSDTSNIRVFPAANQSIAGVIQVSHLNSQNQIQYAFNASEARKVCQSLGLSIASKAQVKKGLSRGLETCRFGWTDEQIAVIPRIHALANCGQNKTGLVPWRASVTCQFDVFCFNKSDALIQLKDTVTDHPLSHSELTQSANSTLTTQSMSSSSSHPFSPLTSDIVSDEVEPAQFVVSAQSSARTKFVLITCICGILLATIAVLAYLKLRRHCFLHTDKKQQQEEQQDYTQTEEWISVKTIAETPKEVQEDQKIEVDNSAE